MTNSEARKRKEESELTREEILGLKAVNHFRAQWEASRTPRIADGVTPFHTYQTTQAQMDAEGYCQYCEEGSEITRGHWHEIFAQFDGASTRTADELASLFIDDVAEIVTTYTRPADLVEPDGWCEDPDASQALSDEILNAENALADVGLYAHWNDGVIIERVTEIDPDAITVHGNGVVELDPTHVDATVCGVCGRGWADGVSTDLTPVPSGRCPFEYDHTDDVR